MSLSDKLSPADRIAYAEEYAPLAKLRDAYVACGDQVNAKKIRRQISDMTRKYQARTKPVWRGCRTKSPTSIWLDESSQFTSEMWNKIKAIDYGAIESRIIQWPRGFGKSHFFNHQLEAYRMMCDKFFPPKEPQMLKIFNSSDRPADYNTAGHAGVELSHLFSKEQMFEIAKIAYDSYGPELLKAIGMKTVIYDEHRAIRQFKRAMSEYPAVIGNYIEMNGYRKIQPYTLEVALRQVAEAERVFQHHFKPKSELPERFYNYAVGHDAPDVAHFSKDSALKEAERIARRTNAEVRTYQLVTTTTIEDVPTTTKQVVRRP